MKQPLPRVFNVWAGCITVLGMGAITWAAGAPQVTSAPAQVQQGGQVTFHISGFAPNSLLTIQLDNARISSMSEYTNNQGTHEMSFTIPANLNAGAHRVVVTDVYNHQAQTTVTVQGKSATPTIKLDPNTGAPGQPVAITGTNWDRRQHFVTMQDAAGHGQTLYPTDGCLLNGPPSDPKKGQACAPGALELMISIPKDARGGQYRIIISDGMVQASAALTVIGGVTPPPVTSAAIAVQPASGPARSSVTVSGSGFAKNAQLTVTWDPTGINAREGTIRTDAQGRFSGLVFQIPGNAAQGTHMVTGVDANNARAAVGFTVTASNVGPGPMPGPTPGPGPNPQPCNPNAPSYSQPGCVPGGGTNPTPTPGPAPGPQACNPNAPLYSQPGCQQGGGPAPNPGPTPTPNPPANKCNPNIPRYAQPGCVG